MGFLIVVFMALTCFYYFIKCFSVRVCKWAKKISSIDVPDSQTTSQNELDTVDQALRNTNESPILETQPAILGNHQTQTIVEPSQEQYLAPSAPTYEFSTDTRTMHDDAPPPTYLEAIIAMRSD